MKFEISCGSGTYVKSIFIDALAGQTTCRITFHERGSLQRGTIASVLLCLITAAVHVLFGVLSFWMHRFTEICHASGFSIRCGQVRNNPPSTDLLRAHLHRLSYRLLSGFCPCVQMTKANPSSSDDDAEFSQSSALAAGVSRKRRCAVLQLIRFSKF